DPSSQGWVVAARGVTGGPAAELSLLSVGQKPNGTPDVPARAGSVPVPQYGLPPPAVQRGTTFLLDTLAGRLTHAVSAFDHVHGGVPMGRLRGSGGRSGRPGDGPARTGPGGQRVERLQPHRHGRGRPDPGVPGRAVGRSGQTFSAVLAAAATWPAEMPYSSY